MHLFAVGWGLSPTIDERLTGELLRTAGGFPHLDAATAWVRRPVPSVVAVGITSPPEIIAPRQYLHEDASSIVLYDGLPLAIDGAFDGYRATALADHWHRLPDALEGRFICMRIDQANGAIELLTDPLGVAQLYVWERDGGSIVSNSAGLIQRVLSATEPDPLGVAMFLAIDWVGADRTLRRDVRVAPAGQHWRWLPGETSWRRRTHWSVASNVPAPRRRMDADIADDVIGGLTSVVRAAARPTGALNAPITGGKDSRMLAAVLMSAGVDARYWTKGDPGAIDVPIAVQIARRYGLPHRIANRPTQAEDGRDPTLDVAAEWSSITRRFALQTDGLASIFLVGNIQGQPDRVAALAVTLSAMCAESARAVHAQEYLCGNDASLARTVRYLPYAETQVPRGLVRAEAYAMARRQVRNWVETAAASGVPVANLPVAFYLDERCRRWASNNPRELAQTEDKVLPFMTRPYVRSVLALHPDERANHQLHRGVIRRLVPELEHSPPLDHPWRSAEPRPGRRRRAYNALMANLPYPARRALVIGRERLRPTRVSRTPSSPYDEAGWLEANLDDARDVMLSRAASPLWAFLDRRTLERLLSPKTSSTERRLNQLPLFAAYTLFLFETIEDELARDSLPAWPVRHEDAGGARQAPLE